MEKPKRRLIGWSDVYRKDFTATETFWILWIPIYSRHFHHSTAWLD